MGVLERENLTPVEIKIESKLLATLRRMLKRMNGAVHIPFQDLENGVSPSRNLRKKI